MIRTLINSSRWLVIPLMVGAFGSVSHGQFRGGTRTIGATPPPEANGTRRGEGSFGRMVDAMNMARAAEFRGAQIGAADLATLRGGLSDFYSSRSPYWSSGMGYGGGYPSYGGYGTMSSAAMPTYYGAAIQPASSAVLADDIAAQQADFQAAFQRVDLRERRIQLRRASFDEAMYEKMNTPAPETVREEMRLQRLARARNTPPLDEIASGTSLNELLDSIRRIEARGQVVGATIQVDPENPTHINVTTTGDQRGSNELFRPAALAKWPALLNTDEFATEKKALLAALGDIWRLQPNGTIDEAKLTKARASLDSLKDRVFEKRFELTISQYTQAAEFLNKLGATVDVLGSRDAAKYLNGTFAAKGDTVSKLADHMIANGLRFARATPGDEAYYSKLYQQMVTFEVGLSRKADEQNVKEARLSGK